MSNCLHHPHSTETLYSNSTVIAGWLQPTRTHYILFLFTVIKSKDEKTDLVESYAIVFGYYVKAF